MRRRADCHTTGSCKSLSGSFSFSFSFKEELAKMVDDRLDQERDSVARLAAAYLDMWEQTASAHALKGPPSQEDEPDVGDGAADD